MTDTTEPTVAVEIKHWSGRVLFAAQVAVSIGERFRLKAALEIAVRSGARLDGARLDGASLVGARLDGARLDGARLVGASLVGASLDGARLVGASLDGARLVGASLDGASLDGASLVGASLVSASLDGASLDGASLDGASLVGATGINRECAIPLLMLLDQPGAIRAYKVVNESGHGHIRGGIRYDMGETYEEPGASTDVDDHCGPGLHVATLDWCIREWRPGYRILVVEFTAADIACIPTATDGKFRLRRLTVVGEKDLAALGLVEAPKADAA